MNAGELCNREVVICTPDATVVAAAQLMRERHVGCLIVVERLDGGNEPVGVVTDRDLVVDAVATTPDELGVRRVSNIMTCELVTAREGEDVATVLSRMKSFGVRRIPVVDDTGQLQGMLAYDDLVEWMAEQLADLTRVVRSELHVEERRAIDV